MFFLSYLSPLYLSAGAGAVLALGVIVGLALARKSITAAIVKLWQGTFSQVGLFYFGMALFMLASVVEAGPVLDKIVMHGALWGYGGYMLIFAFDMIAAVCLRARLNASRVFDKRGMQVQMYGIWLSAFVSISANLAGALQNFHSTEFSHLGVFSWLLPLIGAVFPSMIVVLSLASDHILDTTAISQKVDVKEFEAQERKRVEILKVRLKTEQDLLEEEKNIAVLRTKRDQQSTKPKRELFFWQWLYPTRQHSLDIPALIKDTTDQVTAQLKAIYEPQIEDLKQQISAIDFSLQFESIHERIDDLFEEIASQQEPEIEDTFEEFGEEPAPEFEEDLDESSSQIGLNLERTSPRDSGELEAMPAPKPTLKLVSNSVHTQQEAEDQFESNLTSNSASSSSQESTSQAKRGAYYITMEAAEEITGYTAKFLRAKINKGDIATNPKGDKLKTSDVMKFIREKTSV